MRKLKESESISRVLHMAKRHKRICLQNLNGKKYADAIDPLITSCESKLDEHTELENEYIICTDNVHLNILKINDCLRKLHNRCGEYDRENPGKNITVFIFALGNLSPVIRLVNGKKAEAIADILRKMSTFESSHGLYPLYVELKAAHDLLLNAVNAENAASLSIKDSEIAMEQLKIKLIKQYNDNYHIAAVDFGKGFAEMLFPSVKSKPAEKTPAATKEIVK